MFNTNITWERGLVKMDTTISIYHRPNDVDLSDICDMVKEYCNEVEKLEEKLAEAESRVEELESDIETLQERIKELEG